MRSRIIALTVILLIFSGCAGFRYQSNQADSCYYPYSEYRGYEGPYCSPTRR